MNETDTKNLPKGWAVVTSKYGSRPRSFTVEVNGTPVAFGSDAYELELSTVLHEPDRPKIEAAIRSKKLNDEFDREKEVALWWVECTQRDTARAEAARLAMIQAAEGK